MPIELSNLDVTDGFKIIGETDFDRSGASVSSAGDVNGDGFADLIIGTYGNDAGGSESGAAYVVFGAASGISAVNLDDVAAGIGGFKIIGENAFDLLGFSVSSAGDINGDGFDDLLVGAVGNDAGGNGAGAAYVVFGAASGITSVNLDDVAAGTGGFKIAGEGVGDTAGRSVSSAGDVNGDGFADVIVGAQGYNSGGERAGAAYVVFGAASGITSVNLDDVALGNGGFKINGENADDLAGRSVSTAGDFNGDGFDDLIVGAQGNDYGGNGAGAAYLVFGAASGVTSVNLDDVAAGTGGFKITGENADDAAGLSVSTAGDFNGDGFDDLIIGAQGNSAGVGAAYVVFGAASGISAINLDDVAAGTGGFKIIGENAGDAAGHSVSSAGDVNGDGFDDLLVGAYLNDAGGDAAGAVYLIFGVASGITAVNLADVALGVGGMKITGEVAGDYAGNSVSSAGDVNGDGFVDLIIGGFRNDSGGTRAGASYVVFASAIDIIKTGGAGADNLVGGAGDDQLTGLGGDDRLDGQTGNDSLFGGAGADSLFGGAGVDLLAGQGGNDTLFGQLGNDRLFGGAGNDFLNGQSGADRMDGGTGNDIFIVDNSGDLVIERLSAGTDLVKSFIAFVLPDHVENLTLTGTNSIAGTGNALANIITGNAGANIINGAGGNDRLLGNAGNDRLFGGGGADSLFGGSGADVLAGQGGNDRLFGQLGNDRLFGGAGNDYLNGQSGADRMDGGTGNDIFMVDNSGDVVIERLSAGTDLVKSFIAFALPDHVENLTLTGTNDTAGTGNALANIITGNAGANLIDGGGGNDRLFGQGGNDRLIGNAGNDMLNGGAGADRMEGGAGNDTYVVDDAGDMVIEFAGAGTDRVLSSVDFALSSNLEKLSLIGSADIDGFGNGLSNRIFGNSGANELRGGSGNDFLAGQGGNDKIIGQTGNDRLFGGGGNDVLAGGAGNDQLFGQFGNDILLGQGGNDKLFGQAGDDTLVGGAGDDLFVFTNGGGDDRITDFTTGAGSDDVLDVRAFGFASAAAAIAAATQVGANTVIALDGDDSVTLLGVTVGALNADDFLI